MSLKTLLFCAFVVCPFASSQERAQAVTRFVDSIGVDTHITYTDTAYGNASLVITELQRLGVHHIRDGIPNPSVSGVVEALCASGVTLTANANLPPYSPFNLSSSYATLTVSGKHCIDAFEGANEQDTSQGSPAWYTHWANDYASLLSSVPSGVQVIGPALANMSNHTFLSPVKAGSYGNMHPYPAGQNPSSFIPDQLSLAKALFPNMPIMATETGYHNALNDHRDQPAISLATSAKYIPRLLAEHFNAGTYRTYLYELLDERSPWNTALQDVNGNCEQCNWGLITADGAEKPSFIALRNLLSILSAGATPISSPQDLLYSMSTESSHIHHVLLQKSATVFDLLLWQDVPSWDSRAQTAIANDAAPVHLYLPTLSARVFTPSASTSSVSVKSTKFRFDVTVPDEIVVVEFTSPTLPQAIGGPMLPLKSPQ